VLRHEKRVRSKKQSNKRGEKDACKKATRVKTARVCKVAAWKRERAIRSRVKNSSGAIMFGKEAMKFIIRNNDLEGL